MGAAAAGQLFLAFYASQLAQAIATRKGNQPVADSGPPALAERGAAVPYSLGVNRIKPVQLWSGKRFIDSESADGKTKGFSGADTNVYYEDGWHGINIGQVDSIDRIFMQGQDILAAPLERLDGSGLSTSGRYENLKGRSNYEVFFGDAGQPPSVFLPDASRLGLPGNSRWPTLCHVFWEQLKLGATFNWPIIEYEVAVRPISTLLSGSPGWFDDTDGENSGFTSQSIDFFQPYDPGGSPPQLRCYFDMTWPQAAGLRVGDTLLNNGNTWGGGVLNVKIDDLEIIGGDVTKVRIYPEDSTRVDGNTSGFFELQGSSRDKGANAAHMIAQLMFEPWPYGLDFDTADYDLQSLEDLGQLIQAEDLRSHYYSAGGDTFLAMHAAILQDIGCLFIWDKGLRKYRWRPLREVDPSVFEWPSVPDTAFSDGMPPLARVHSPKKNIQRISYVFTDARKNHKKGSLPIKDDGNVGGGGYRIQEIELPTVRHPRVAGQVAERRSQEALATNTEMAPKLRKQLRKVEVGDTIKFDRYANPYRVMSYAASPYSGDVTLGLVKDEYGVPASTFSAESGISGGGGNLQPVVQDSSFSLVEFPVWLAQPYDPITYIMPRLRGHGQVYGSLLRLSTDDSSFVTVARGTNAYAGGTLTASIDASDPDQLDNTITFNVSAVESDLLSKPNYTADDDSFFAGRLLALIGTEFFIIDGVNALGGGVYEVNRALRARYGSSAASHAVGETIYIFEPTKVPLLRHPMIFPGVTLYGKSVPVGAGSTFETGIASTSSVVYGAAERPLAPPSLYVTDPLEGVPEYAPGSPVSLAWTYYNTLARASGAGVLPAGVPLVSASALGRFRITMRDAGETVSKVYETSSAVLTITDADITSTFGSHPASFVVDVENLHNGYASDKTSLTITSS